MGEHIRGRVVHQSKTLIERVEEATHLKKHFQVDWHLLVDSPENGDPFLHNYGAWPTRYFLVKDNKMMFISEPNEGLCDLLEVLGNDK